MTSPGICAVFIPDRVLLGWCRSQWNASERNWAGSCIIGCQREHYISAIALGFTVV